MAEVKLLTEADADRLFYKSHTEAMAELRERGLIAQEPVDALLIEAREICAKWCDEQQCSASANEYRSGEYDNVPMITVALAALRRGMELAPAASPLTRQQLAELLLSAGFRFGGGLQGQRRVDRLHAALTEGQSK